MLKIEETPDLVILKRYRVKQSWKKGKTFSFPKNWLDGLDLALGDSLVMGQRPGSDELVTCVERAKEKSS